MDSPIRVVTFIPQVCCLNIFSATIVSTWTGVLFSWKLPAVSGPKIEPTGELLSYLFQQDLKDSLEEKNYVSKFVFFLDILHQAWGIYLFFFKELASFFILFMQLIILYNIFFPYQITVWFLFPDWILTDKEH